jgi:hypothetical protein
LDVLGQINYPLIIPTKETSANLSSLTNLISAIINPPQPPNVRLNLYISNAFTELSQTTASTRISTNGATKQKRPTNWKTPLPAVPEPTVAKTQSFSKRKACKSSAKRSLRSSPVCADKD